MSKYVDYTTFFDRVRDKYPSSEYLFKCGPGSGSLTVYPHDSNKDKVIIDIGIFLSEDESISFEWNS